MRKLTKALAAVLLLAVIVSVMAVLPSFTVSAAEGESEATSERVVVWDMDEAFPDGKNFGFNSNGVLEANAHLNVVPDGTGNTYYQHIYEEDYANSGKFWTISMPSATSSDKAIILQDMFKFASTSDCAPLDDDGDGKYDVAYAKNTDYIVIDFDISTDSEFVDGITFHTRFSSDRRTSTLAYIVQSGYSYLYLNENTPGDSVRAGNGDYSNKNYYGKDTYAPLFDSERKWVDVTVVYDVSAVLPAEEIDKAYADGIAAGTAAKDLQNKWNEYKGYLYLDGYYVGELSANFYRSITNYNYQESSRYAKSFYDIRVETGTLNPGSTTNFDNFTISKFPVNYEGDLTENLGKPNVHLSAMEDMMYCLENKAGGTPSRYADLVRMVDGKETVTPIYDLDDLSGDLQNGDTVRVIRAFDADYIAVTDGDVITWADAEGEPLAADSPLMPTLLTVPDGVDWAVIVNGEVTASGMAADIYATEYDLNGDGDTDDFLYTDGNYNYQAKRGGDFKTSVREYAAGIIDPMFAAINSTKNTVVMLFGDVTSYGPGYSKLYEGVVNSTSATKKISGNFKFDLNGNTLTVMPGYAHYLTTAGGDITVKNGELSFTYYGGNMFYSPSDNGSVITLESIKCEHTSGTFFDFRGGDFIVKNSDIDVPGAISYMKAQNGEHGRIIVLDSNIVTSSDDGFAKLSNVSGAYGSFDLAIIIDDSDIHTTKGEFVRIEVTTNTKTSEVAKLNDNFANISVINNSTIKSYSNTIQAIMVSADDDTTDLWIKLRVIDSTIEATSPVYMQVTKDYVSAHEWTLDVDARFYGDTNLYCRSGSTATGLVNLEAATCKRADLNLYIEDGVHFSDPLIFTDETKKPDNTTVKLGALGSSKIAYTSLGGDYNCIVTPSYDTYTYKLGEQKAVEFYWNKPTDETVDEFNIDKVVTLAEATDVYKYEWKTEGNAWIAQLDNSFKFKAKSTLILENDLTYNFYVEKTDAFDALLDAGVVVMINGTQLTKESATAVKDGVTYYVVRVLDIAPTAAANNAISFTVSINGAYGETGVEVISGQLSVLDYIEGILTKSTNDKSIELMYAILNYITAAHAYEGSTADARVTELLGDYTAKHAIEGAGKFAKPDDVTSISAYYGATVGWGFKGTAGTELTVKYGDEEKTVVLSDNGIVYVDVPAQYFASGVTVNGKALNLKGYYDALTSDAAKAITEALWNYSYAAAEYAANK